MYNLPLQVGNIHSIRIRDGNATNASGGKVLQDGRSKTSRPNDCNSGLPQPLLRLWRETRKIEVPGVAPIIGTTKLSRRITDCIINHVF